MKTYGFRLRVANLGPGLNSSADSLPIADGVRLAVTGSFDSCPRYLYLRGERFSDEAAANDAARAYADALRLAGVALRWPLRVGQDVGGMRIASSLAKGPGWQRLSGAPGLIIFDEEQGAHTSFLSMSATGSVLSPPGRFVLAIESYPFSEPRRGSCPLLG